MDFLIFGVVPVALLWKRNLASFVACGAYLLMLFRAFGEDVACAKVLVFGLLTTLTSFAVWLLIFFFRRY